VRKGRLAGIDLVPESYRDRMTGYELEVPLS
jgi:hypothetical protein